MNSLKDVLFFLESKNIEDLDVLDLSDASDVEDMNSEQEQIDSSSDEQDDVNSTIQFVYLADLNNDGDHNIAYQQLSDILCGVEGDHPTWQANINTNNFDIRSGVKYADYIDELKGLSNDEISKLLHHNHFQSVVPGVFEFEVKGEPDIANIVPVQDDKQQKIDAINAHLETDPIANDILGKATEVSPEKIVSDDEEALSYISELQKIVDESTDEELRARLQEIILNLQTALSKN